MTLELDVTTCTFVRMVSRATKNPEPRPDEVSMVTTAGEARLTRSSSEVVDGAGGVGGSPASRAVGGGGVAVSATVVSDDGDLRTSGRDTLPGAGLGDATVAGEVASARGRARDNHHRPPAATIATAAAVRTIADAAVRDEAASPFVAGDAPS